MIRIPSRKVCEEFHLTYELKGAQRGVDVLTRYYGIRRMKIVVDGHRVLMDTSVNTTITRLTSLRKDSINEMFYTKYSIMS